MSYQSRASPPYLSSLGHWETRAQTPSLASCISTESREQGREAKRMREQRLINDSDSKQHASPLWSLLLASAAPVTLLFSVSVGNKTLWQSVFLVSSTQHEKIFLTQIFVTTAWHWGWDAETAWTSRNGLRNDEMNSQFYLFAVSMFMIVILSTLSEHSLTDWEFCQQILTQCQNFPSFICRDWQ